MKSIEINRIAERSDLPASSEDEAFHSRPHRINTDSMIIRIAGNLF